MEKPGTSWFLESSPQIPEITNPCQDPPIYVENIQNFL